MQHNVRHVTLKNGAEGLYIDMPGAGVVAIDIVFRAGDYLSPAGKTDTAHVMEHLVLGANKKYPSAKEYSREFSKYGAYNNAYTGDYHMGYEAECEASEAARITDLLCDAIEAPLFTQTDFIAEIGNVREELKMRRNNDDVELSLMLEDAMGFVPKSFKQRESELSAITLADVHAHYKKTHTSSNMRFVIAGPMDHLQKPITERLASIALPKGTGYIELPDEQPKQLKSPLLVRNANLDNLCYRWEAVLPMFSSLVQRDSLSALQELLFNGIHSRVFGDLREKGLVYGIFGSNYETKHNVVNVISGQVQTANIADVFEILHKEIATIANNGLPEKEVQDLRKRAYGEVQRYNQTASQLSGWYRQPFITRNEIIYFDAFAERLEHVTSSSIQAIAQAILEAPIDGLGIMHNDTEVPDARQLFAKLKQG